MEQNAVDNRVAAVLARRAGASSSAQYPVTIEQGSEPLRNRVPSHQIDSTVACSQFKEPEKPKGFKAADELDANAAPLAPDTIVRIGEHVTLAPSTVNGFEARFTRNWSAYDVSYDGEILRGDAGLKVLYEALRETPDSNGNG